MEIGVNAAKSAGAETRQRQRQCNKPKPANGGKDCEGPNKETQACGTKTVVQVSKTYQHGFHLKNENAKSVQE